MNIFKPFQNSSRPTRIKSKGWTTVAFRYLCTLLAVGGLRSAPAAELHPFSLGGRGGESSTLSLTGEWRFKPDTERPDGSSSDFGGTHAKKENLTELQKRDRVGYGEELGYHMAGFNDSDWSVIRVGTNWEQQGYPGYDGPAWYRQEVLIPKEWEESSVYLQLGRPDDRGTVFWNGDPITTVNKFGPHFAAAFSPGQLKYGEKNTIAVRIYDWYKTGGLSSGEFKLTVLKPFGPASEFKTSTMQLGITRDIPADVMSDPRWKYGWRDEGTSDTRPKMSRIEDAFQGRDAVAMEVWYPNSTEMVDFRLGEDENGLVWREHAYDYISFRVKSEMDGEMQMRLNRGDVRWQRGGTSYSARFRVEAGDWKQVILPFSAFLQKDAPLGDTQIIDTVSLGYGNHELREAGKVLFANFEVGHFEVAPEGRPIPLDGLWRFRQDNRRPDGTASDFSDERDKQGYGLELGYHTTDYDDSDWAAIHSGTNWESQGFGGYNGVAWYRQRVMVPAEWKGQALRLQLGQPDDRGEIYFNGDEVGVVEKFGPQFDVTIDPAHINYGEYNTIAVRIHDWYHNGGIVGAPFQLGPKDARVLIRWRDKEHTDSVSLDTFDMGPLPPSDRTVEIAVRFMGGLTTSENPQMEYRLADCFHRTVAAGRTSVRRTDGGNTLEALIRLDADQTRQFYYGEWIDVSGMLLTDANEPVTAFIHYRQKLTYEKRNDYELPALPETYEETPMGRLRLVDVIKPGEAPENGVHPYKQGGVRDFWGGRRAYATWLDGIQTREFKDRRYREATNNQHFGYRIGRNGMKRGEMYLLRVLYPEDKSRYVAMDIKAGRNYQGVGFRTGVGPDDPITPYPLSGEYQWSDHIVALDDTTYGYEGAQTAPSDSGFWVFFHDIGRVYASQYDSGPAVAEMRLYRIENPEQHYPEIRYPEGAEHRVLMMDWERQPDANPEDIAEYARLMGLNALGPVMLKWSFNGYYPNEQGYEGAPEWFKIPPHRDGFGNENCWRILGMWLDASRDQGVTLFPRLEYGGSKQLPKEARVIGTNGKVDPCGRYTPWGANLLHPATLEDIKVMLDDVVGANAEKYSNLGGILWRMRSDRVKCSYGKNDVEMFCRETGREMPEGDAAAIAKWASDTVGDAYHDWWHVKRRDFHVKVRDYMQKMRPDLKLYYYNWDPDGWRLSQDNNQRNTAKDWSDAYNIDRARLWYERKIEEQKKLTDQEYLRRLTDSSLPMVNEPHKRLRTELYKNVDDIALFAPVHWDYLADNEPYIQYFKTGDGLAVCNMFHYEEKGRSNVQNDNFETSEMTPAGPQFSMADEVLSVFHGDPNVITWTPYTVGRSFTTEHRRFAQAFLALPAMRGEVVKDAVGEALMDDVRVRVYSVDKQTYVSVTHRGYGPGEFQVSVPLAAKSTEVVNLVTGAVVPAVMDNDRVVFTVDSRAMELNSFVIR